MKHFNHSIRVNESSESFSHCEEVILHSSSKDEEVQITCSVTSAPKSILVWGVASDGNKVWMSDQSDHDKVWMYEKLVENCTVHNTYIYICTSTTSQKISKLRSKITEIHCEARFQNMTSASDACVTLVYENFSPPSSSGMCLTLVYS